MQNVKFDPVAIIGVACALPGCGKNLNKLAEIFDKRQDMVRSVPENRREYAGIGDDFAFSDCALIDDIEMFDPSFFGLSRRESRQMDPQQRYLLKLSCEAIWNAGYSLKHLKGSPTAVVLGSARNTYASLMNETHQKLVTDDLAAAQAGRISYFLDLRGPSQIVDTACSSSLYAVYDACTKLSLGIADMAIAGGFRLMCSPPAEKQAGSEAILSPSGRARSFDAKADGTGLGEGGALFLLKPLAQAQKDEDYIHAVILGGATNQDGQRGVGFTAPSPKAQKEMLLAAWENSLIDPSSLGFIEAHGTGTRLGDPIEFEALTAAFSTQTENKHFCSLSSAKSNFGHLDSAAGALGILKTIIAINNGTLYSSAHFSTPNPMLDVENSALKLKSSSEKWISETPRRAGISGFGLTGTNVHLILEQAPILPEAARLYSEAPKLIPISAKSPEALRSHAKEISEYLKINSCYESLSNLAYTQSVGRDHERWRACILASNAMQAAEQLDILAETKTETLSSADYGVAITLLSHDAEIVSPDITSWLAALPALSERFKSIIQDVNKTPKAEKNYSENLLRKVLLAGSIIEAGISERFMIGHGDGNIVMDLIRGKTSLKTALECLAELGTVKALEEDKFRRAILQTMSEGEPVFISPWSGQVSNFAKKEYTNKKIITLESIDDPQLELLGIISRTYCAGVDIDWSKFNAFFGTIGRRVPIPTSLFAEEKCWIDPRKIFLTQSNSEDLDQKVVTSSPLGKLKEDEGSATENKLAVIWCDLLGNDAVSRDDDFYDEGGDSLMQTQLDNAIMRDFGIQLSIDVIYEYPVLHEMATYLDSLAPDTTVSDSPVFDKTRTVASASHSQKRMWVLQQLNKESGAYNVSLSFKIDTEIDAKRLRKALNELSGRHSILRTQLVLEDGELVQKIKPNVLFDLTVEKKDPSVTDLTNRLNQHANLPFDLSKYGSARALLIVDNKAQNSWFQIVLHHANCDEWSIHLLLSELTYLYNNPSSEKPNGLDPPDAQFVDWAVWEKVNQEGEEFKAAADYWKNTLKGVPSELDIPTDFSRGPSSDYAGAWLEIALPSKLIQDVKTKARRYNGTLFTWLVTGYAAWLARLCQTEDFVVGVPVAGRYHSSAEKMLGCFINTLPLRVDASGDPSFLQLFERINIRLKEAFKHQRFPFDSMVEQLGVGGVSTREPLVQTLLSLQNSSRKREYQFEGSALEPIRLGGDISWFELSAVLKENPNGGLSGILAYRTALFEEKSILSFWNDWQRIVEAGLTAPDQSIYTILSEDEW